MNKFREYISWLNWIMALGSKAPLMLEKIQKIIAILEEIKELFPEIPQPTSAAIVFEGTQVEMQPLLELEEQVIRSLPVPVGSSSQKTEARFDGHRLRELYKKVQEYGIIRIIMTILPFVI